MILSCLTQTCRVNGLVWSFFFSQLTKVNLTSPSTAIKAVPGLRINKWNVLWLWAQEETLMALSCTFKQPMFDLEKSPLISKGLYTVEMKLKTPNNFTHVFYNSTCSPYNSFDIICNVLKFPFICEHREIISPIDESTNNWRNVQWTSLTEAHVRWLVVHSCCTHRPLTLTKSCSVCCSEIFFALFEAASENKSHFQERAKKKTNKKQQDS